MSILTPGVFCCVEKEIDMKKVFGLLMLLSFILSACAPAVQGLVALPDEARLLVLSLFTAGVTWVLLWLSMRFGVDLAGYANAIAAALAPVIITLIELGLKAIPPAFDNIVLTIIHLLVLLIGSLGAFFLFKRKA